MVNIVLSHLNGPYQLLSILNKLFESEGEEENMVL